MRSNPSDFTDKQAEHSDARIRQMLSSLPASPDVDVQGQVLSRVRRRRMALRGGWLVSFACLLVVFAWWNPVGRDGQQPTLVAHDSQPSDTRQASDDIDELELFASAYQVAPPVVRLESLESEAEALLSYLGSLEAATENQQ